MQEINKEVLEVLEEIKGILGQKTSLDPLMSSVIRNMDSLGRITIPKEYRRFMNIGNTSQLEMVLVKEGILIKKVNE